MKTRVLVAVAVVFLAASPVAVAQESDPRPSLVDRNLTVTPVISDLVTPIGMAMGAGELAMITWLLFWGARDDRSTAVAAAR